MTRTVGIWLSMMCIGIVCATAATAASTAPPPTSHVVKDPGNRFTITVPADWNVQTSSGGRTPAVSAISPPASGQLSDSVDVIAQDLPIALSPQGCAGEVAQIMRFTIHEWTTLQEGPATLAGLPAYSRSYTWRTRTGQDRRSVQTCVTMGRRAFVIVGTTANTQSDIQEHLARLEQIMATFRPNAKNLPDTQGPGTLQPQEGGSK
jgi:DcrB